MWFLYPHGSLGAAGFGDLPLKFQDSTRRKEALNPQIVSFGPPTLFNNPQNSDLEHFLSHTIIQLPLKSFSRVGIKLPGFNSPFPNHFFPTNSTISSQVTGLFSLFYFSWKEGREEELIQQQSWWGEKKLIGKCDESPELIPAWAAMETLVLTKKN